MPYLAMDLERATGLVRVLRDSAARIDPIVNDLHTAELLAEFVAGVDVLLLEIEANYWTSAAQVATATAELQSLELQLSTWFEPPPVPVRTPVPTADPRDRQVGEVVSGWSAWNAAPDMDWNLVVQDASHNSYRVPGGIAALYLHGVRSFELDIHRGAPTNPLRPRTGSWARWFTETVIDHFDHAGGRDHDWRVYHVSGNAQSEYDYLSDGLSAIAALDSTDPITVFIDNKDAFGGTQKAAQFDELLEAALGDRLFRPGDLMARASGAETLQEAVEYAGWPTVEELEGKVLVVLTDEIDSYHGVDGGRATGQVAAFVALPPRFAGGPGIGDDAAIAVHVPDPNVVFYNADHRSVNAKSIAAISATNSVVRTYFNPRCDSTLLGEPGAVANYRAVDIMLGEQTCPWPAPAPPEATPVPE